MKKRRIAILGGGMGALAAAARLTERPDWNERYEIAIYEQSWRLGGKGASGRNERANHRNEEHGFHILFGFYENTFRLMRTCYAELGRSPESPLSEFAAPSDDHERRHPDRYAVHRQHHLALSQVFRGELRKTPLLYPPENRIPGDGDAGTLDARGLIQILGSMLTQLGARLKEARPDLSPQRVRELQLLLRLGYLTVGAVPELLLLLRPVDSREGAAKGWLARYAGDALRWGRPHWNRRLCDAIATHLRKAWHELKARAADDWETYLSWTLQDFIGTNLIGILSDDLLVRGFDVVNGENYWEFLARHATVEDGAELTRGSLWVQGAYDSSFAFRNGVTEGLGHDSLAGFPCMEAGTMLRGGLRLVLGYRGAVSWLFRAGSGEVLFAPLYQMLLRRGVRFHFFHQVETLGVDVASRSRIERIELLRPAAETEYQPLVDIDGLACWPSRPLLEQFGDVHAPATADDRVDWRTRIPVRRETLYVERDFDDVILGIPVGALDTVCRELAAQQERWRAMLESLRTIGTQGLQLWFDRNKRELVPSAEAVITPCSTGSNPFATWADMSHVIRRERWTAEVPRHLAYLCGPMADSPKATNGAHANSDVRAQDSVVRETGRRFLKEHGPMLWPGAAGPSHGLLAEYARANVEGWERYVLSAPDSSCRRLTAGESGYANLVLAGDWIRTGLDCGCMEAAVLSGLQAARVLAGDDAPIPGERDARLGPGGRFSNAPIRATIGRQLLSALRRRQAVT